MKMSLILMQRRKVDSAGYEKFFFKSHQCARGPAACKEIAGAI